MLRRIRGAIGIGLSWAFVWSAVGAVPRWVLGINTDAPLSLVFGVFGFIAGLTFASIVALAERRSSFDQLSLHRFAGWGAVGGLLLSSVFARLASFGWHDVLLIAPAFAIASAICASGSLALARRTMNAQLRA